MNKSAGTDPEKTAAPAGQEPNAHTPIQGPSQGPLPVPNSRYLLFAIVLAATLGSDLWTKQWVFSWPDKLTGRVYWLWEGFAGFQTSLNEGALFGMGQGQVYWFAIVSMVAAIGIPLWLFVWRAASDFWLTVTLAGILGGVLGNLYDRLGMHGEVWPEYYLKEGERVYAVRDWILWQASDAWRWPNFNLADAFLVVGTGILFLRVMLEPTQEID